MIHKVAEYIKDKKLISQGDGIVIGVSGGADSVCLLYMLYELCAEYDMKLYVVHVNHGIRGLDADTDEQYVFRLCGELKLPFESYQFDVKKIAVKDKISEEEAGRKIRYQSFIHACHKFGCNKIAVAHNRNDNAETILFNMFRGSGISGLSGINPLHRIVTGGGQVIVIRPLLCVLREEIEEFLNDKNISYKTDATNLSNDYSRNKIRNHILSYATANINNKSVEHIVMASEHLYETEGLVRRLVKDYYQKHVHEKDGLISFNVKVILKEDIVIRRGVILKIISSLAGGLKDIESKHVELVLALMDKQVGKRINLPYGIIAQKEYDNIILYCSKKNAGDDRYKRVVNPITVKIPGNTIIPGYNKYIEACIVDNNAEKLLISKNNFTKWFDYDKIENAVVLRNRRDGDYLLIKRSRKANSLDIRVKPCVLYGRKKLKDYYIDMKIPKEERYYRHLIADGSHIMWIIGDENRISERYKIDEKTKRILIMSFKDAKEN